MFVLKRESSTAKKRQLLEAEGLNLMKVKRTSRFGFTLVEILIVVTIIGIAGAVVVPQMTRTGSLTIQAAGRIIIADLLVAQNEAIANQATRQVVFDLANNRYRIADGDGKTIGMNWKSGDASAGNYVTDFEDDSRFEGVKIINAAFGGDSAIEFDALGGPDTNGFIDIQYGTGSDMVQYRIKIAPLTGRVTIAPL